MRFFMFTYGLIVGNIIGYGINEVRWHRKETARIRRMLQNAYIPRKYEGM